MDIIFICQDSKDHLLMFLFSKNSYFWGPIFFHSSGNLGNARLQGLQSEILDGSDKKFSIVLCS